MLDSNHPPVQLFLELLHHKHWHQSVYYLSALILQNYMFIRLRTTFRSRESECVTCRKDKAQSWHIFLGDAYSSIRFHPLTPEKTYSFPFYQSVKRSTEKRWGFLFTCLTTHAVNFEVVSSRETSNCVNGIERFVFRRVVPSVLWLNNGTN